MNARSLAVMKAVVDHPRDLEPLLRRDRLLLDHRGDRQDVVRREVLRARIGKVDRAPVPLKGSQLRAHKLGRPGPLRELVRRREKETLQRMSSEPGNETPAPRSREVRRLVET